MLSKEKLFENLFDDKNIIPARLSDFTGDTINRLTANNGGGDYTVLIALIQGLYDPFKSEIEDVDTSVNIQRGKTLTNDEVMADFIKTMSIKKGVIADALGGEGTPAFLEFYPHGQNEYTQATKAQMPTLVVRIFNAAVAHATALGATNTTLLKSYKALWENSRTAQEVQMGTVSDNRAERSTHRTPLELGLTQAVHTIAAKFPGDVTTCSQFFDFSLLFPVTHHQHQTFTLTIPANGISMVTNKLYTDSNRIHIGNTDDNANLLAYLAPANNTPPNGVGIEVKAGHGVNARPSKFGDLDNPFLLIKNLSDVNELNCEVDITS